MWPLFQQMVKVSLAHLNSVSRGFLHFPQPHKSDNL